MSRFTPYARGLSLSALGMLVISPDGLLTRLVQDAGTWDVAFWRTSLSGLAVTAFVLARHRSRAPRVVRALGWRGWVAGGLVAVANLALTAALLLTTVTNALLLLATMPLWGALLGRILIGERVRARTWLAIGTAFTGAAIILWSALGGGTLVGAGFAALAAACHGLSLVTLRRVGDADRSPVIAIAGIAAALVALPFADPLSVTARDLPVLLALGLVVLPVGLVLFISGTRTVPAAEVALLSLVETVLGPVWVWLVIHEVPSALAVAGGLLVIGAIVGNALLALRERAQST